MCVSGEDIRLRTPGDAEWVAGLGCGDLAMRAPRFRIALGMTLVAIVGFNCWAIRMILWDYGGPIADQVGIGALLMANVLIIVPLLSYPYRGARPFLWGFELFGVAAVALYVALTILLQARVPFLTPYIRLAEDRLIGAWRPPWTDPRLLMRYIILSLWVSLPQLAFALIGGLLFRSVGHATWKQPSTAWLSEPRNSILPEI